MLDSSAEYARLIQGCESEKLHLSGAIQAFGALLRIDSVTNQITHASANLATFIGLSPALVLGKPAAILDWLPKHCLDGLSMTEGKTAAVTNVAWDGMVSIDANLIRAHDGIVIELEKNPVAKNAIAFHQHQRPLMSVPTTPEEMELYHNTLLAAFRAISGFRRCMIYRFQEDWVGEVIAEVADEGSGAYLGLRFPASDIPAIARKLYLMNASRMIPDAAASPVPIASLDNTAPDLSWSDLRSVSPVHLEYLQNMGVAASFSVPIKVAGRLWGLVACHHGEPRVLSPDQRAACVSLTAAYTMGLTSYTSGYRLQLMDSLDRKTDALLEAIAQHGDPLDGIERNGERLMRTLDASGFALAVGSDVAIAGDGPDLDAAALLDDWFLNECLENIFLTDHLADVFPENSLAFSGVAGFIGIKARSLRSGWLRLYWFRPAELQEVAWAGNPIKPGSENPGALSLSPRRSFERWVETKRDYSRAWSNEHRLVASKFRNGLLRWL
jgi:light-regulated signal transduction histidine kinase (bacteriophytochrome)